MVELVCKDGGSYLVPRPYKMLKYYVHATLVQQDPPRNRFQTFKLNSTGDRYYEIPNP